MDAGEFGATYTKMALTLAPVAVAGALGLVTLLMTGTSCSEPQHTCKVTPMSFERTESTIKVRDFTIRLEQPDSSASPTTWEGPVSIQRKNAIAACSVQTLGLIDHPIMSFNDRYLALATYSGSNFRVEVVDLERCEESFATPKLTGPITVEGGRIMANGGPIAGMPCSHFQ
jgi:hypothetical protein